MNKPMVHYDDMFIYLSRSKRAFALQVVDAHYAERLRAMYRAGAIAMGTLLVNTAIALMGAPLWLVCLLATVTGWHIAKVALISNIREHVRRYGWLSLLRGTRKDP